jgi:hypothetical protein
MAGLERAIAFVPVRDLDRAERCYGEVLGLALRDARIAWFKDPDGNALSLTQHG